MFTAETEPNAPESINDRVPPWRVSEPVIVFEETTDIVLPPSFTRLMMPVPLMLPAQVRAALVPMRRLAAVAELLTMLPPPPGRVLSLTRLAKVCVLPFKSRTPPGLMVSNWPDGVEPKPPTPGAVVKAVKNARFSV